MIALYGRTSTDQQETGLASQVSAAQRHAREKYPDEEVAEFLDDGFTGSNLERPRLEELRNQVRAGRIRVVLAYDPDRLSRNVVDLLVLVNELERGAVIDFVNGGFDQSPTGRLLLQMRGVIAEYERTQIRARTQRGRMEMARKGLIAGGRSTFGYTQAKGALTVNESQAEVVRRAFALARAGESIRSIVGLMNESGVLPQRSQRWQKSSMARILRNEVYVGRATYNRRRRGNDGAITFRPESEWIPLAVPAIVDRDTFDQVQSQLRKNASLLSGQRKRQYLLTGLLRCACGFRICGCASHGKRFYRCTGREPLRDPLVRHCRGHFLNADTIERTVQQAVRQILSGGVLAQKVAEHGPKVQAVDYAAEIAKADKAIATWRATEERATRFLVAPEHASRQALFLKELSRASEQRVLAEERRTSLERAREADAAIKAGSAGVREMSRIAPRALARLTPGQWQRVLRLVLDEVTIDGRRIELRGILPSDPAVFRTEHQHVVDGSQRSGIPFVFHAELPGRAA